MGKVHHYLSGTFSVILAAALAGVLASPDGGAALGAEGRRRALVTHDPARNAETLSGIYETLGGGQ